MKMETLLPPVEVRASPVPSQQVWPAMIALFAAMLCVVAAYAGTLRSMIVIWERSQTYAHGFLIVPIAAWLAWRERDAIARARWRPNLLVLPLLALAGSAWLIGEMTGAGVLQQYAVVVMLVLLPWIVLGTEAMRAAAFPLAFLLCAVPFGEFLLPPLMNYTADFTVRALQLSGVPVYREGLFFSTPTGSWSIIEACSGLRYLIASFTGGLLYAYLRYRSYTRRVAFVGASIVVPLVANWLRAYLIVMLSEATGAAYAYHIDHVIYGWVFFAMVTLLLFWVGSLWREDSPDGHAAARVEGQPFAYRSQPLAFATAAALAALAALVWPAIGAGQGDDVAYARAVVSSPAGAGGWHETTAAPDEWRPAVHGNQGEDVRVAQTYAKDGVRVGLHMLYYGHARLARGLVSSGNVPGARFGHDWRKIAVAERSVHGDGGTVPFEEVELLGERGHVLVWYAYWIDGEYTANPYRAKLLQAKALLLGRDAPSAMILLHTAFDADRDAAAARLQAYARAMLPGITARMDHAR